MSQQFLRVLKDELERLEDELAHDPRVLKLKAVRRTIAAYDPPQTLTEKVTQRISEDAQRAPNRDVSADLRPCQEDAAAGNPPPTPEAAPPKDEEPGEVGGRSRDGAHIREGAGDAEEAAEGIRPENPALQISQAASREDGEANQVRSAHEQSSARHDKTTPHAQPKAGHGADFPPVVMGDDPLPAGTLGVLTETAAAAFRGLNRLLGKSCSYGEIALAGGLKGSQIQYALDGLMTKGYIANIGVRGCPQWQILAVGEPRVSARGDAPETWTDEQDKIIKTAAKSGELSLAAISAKVGNRGEAAVIARLSKWGLYHEYKRSRAGFDARQLAALRKPAAALPAPPPVRGIGGSAGRTVEEVEGETTIDDLSARARGVLKAIVSFAEVTKITDGEIAMASDVEVKRLEFLYGRLLETGCIEQGKGNRYVATELGLKLAAKLREVVVSTPVIKKPVSEALTKANGKNGSTETTDQLDVAAYLQRRGTTVSRLAGGMFMVNGQRRPMAEVLSMVNAIRLSQDPPLRALGMSDVK